MLYIFLRASGGRLSSVRLTLRFPNFRHSRFASLCTLVFLAAGCASSGIAPPIEHPESSPGPALSPGDAINVQVWREADLSGMFTVDDRGIVTMPLLGERDVTGLGPSELRDKLLSDYREYLQNPSIEVTILRRISILGEVRSPGLYPVDATVSLSDALALAGGLAPNANSNDIRLVRDQQMIRQDLDSATLIGVSDIRSGDQIVVGEKGWISRNPGAFFGSLIAAGAIITTALIR